MSESEKESSAGGDTSPEASPQRDTQEEHVEQAESISDEPPPLLSGMVSNEGALGDESSFPLEEDEEFPGHEDHSFLTPSPRSSLPRTSVDTPCLRRNSAVSPFLLLHQFPTQSFHMEMISRS